MSGQGRVDALQGWWLREKKAASGSKQRGVCFPEPAFTGCVTWGKGLDLSGLLLHYNGVSDLLEIL